MNDSSKNLNIGDMDFPLKKLSGIACALSHAVDANLDEDSIFGIGLILEGISKELNDIYHAVTG